jgi:hypothetical protein
MQFLNEQDWRKANKISRINHPTARMNTGFTKPVKKKMNPQMSSSMAGAIGGGVTGLISGIASQQGTYDQRVGMEKPSMGKSMFSDLSLTQTIGGISPGWGHVAGFAGDMIKNAVGHGKKEKAYRTAVNKANIYDQRADQLQNMESDYTGFAKYGKVMKKNQAQYGYTNKKKMYEHGGMHGGNNPYGGMQSIPGFSPAVGFEDPVMQPQPQQQMGLPMPQMMQEEYGTVPVAQSGIVQPPSTVPVADTTYTDPKGRRVEVYYNTNRKPTPKVDLNANFQSNYYRGPTFTGDYSKDVGKLMESGMSQQEYQQRLAAQRAQRTNR